MSNQNKQRKFTKSLTFKVLCGLAVLVFLGLIYNLIVASDDAPMTEQEEEEVQKRNADADTIDIVGDYLWPNMKPSKEDMMTDEEKLLRLIRLRLVKMIRGRRLLIRCSLTNTMLLSLHLLQTLLHLQNFLLSRQHLLLRRWRLQRLKRLNSISTVL